jgi:hypothetical protein
VFNCVVAICMTGGTGMQPHAGWSVRGSSTGARVVGPSLARSEPSFLANGQMYAEEGKSTSCDA